jgi:hypothetical protein
VLFSVADDSRGFGDVCSSNLCINKLEGMPPDLSGETINPMAVFGVMTETGPDLGHWKACGMTSVGDDLFVSVSRMHYMRAPYWKQQAWDSSLIKSSDGGATWTPAPHFGRAMFPGQNFATPGFIDYGRDVTNAPDGADRYLYALSTTGHWNNGHSVTLGRVLRSKVALLDPGDWQFAHGFYPDARPDLTEKPWEDLVWRSRHETAFPVHESAGRCGATNATWVPALNLYIMPQWHYPSILERGQPERWQHSRWEFYSAPAPWGPWSLFLTHDFDPEGFYNPLFASRFVSEDGTRMWFLTCGDFDTWNYYQLHVGELRIEIE